MNVGDRAPFEVGENKFELELLALNISSDEAFARYDLPHYDQNHVCYSDKNKKYVVVRISPKS